MSRINAAEPKIVGAGCVLTYVSFNRSKYTLDMLVLVVRGRESGKLSFPKGRMEEMDRVPIVCAHRETREETGYAVRLGPETAYWDDALGHRYYLVGPNFRRLDGYVIRDANTCFAGWVDVRYLRELARESPHEVNRGIREFFGRDMIVPLLKLHGIQ